MVVRCCPQCGQVIPPKKLFPHQPVKRRIYEYVARHPEGVSRRQIIDAVYANDPDGGPISESIISCHLFSMRPTLHAAGVNITSPRGRGGGCYKLEKYDGR
jgi:hypothetical protein